MECKVLKIKDMGQLNDLYQLAFDDVLPINFFEWKYFANPLGEAVVLGMYIDDELVGSGALIPEKIKFNLIDFTIYKFTDLMTSPKHQKKGISSMISKRLTEIGLKDGLIIYTLCSKIATRSFVKAGWTHIASVNNLFSPVLLNNPLIRFKSSSFKLVSDNLEATILQIPDKLIGSDYHLDRKSELIWRVKNPKFNYLILIDLDVVENVIKGFILLSVKNKVANILFANHLLGDEKLGLMFQVMKSKLRYEHKAILKIDITTKSFLAKQNGILFFKNNFNRGPFRSILDFNYISLNPDYDISNFVLSSINYDDF